MAKSLMKTVLNSGPMAAYACVRVRYADKSQPAPLVDDQCVLIHDLYPKARRHALLMARDPTLDGPEQLTALHIPLLEHMQAGILSASALQSYCQSTATGHLLNSLRLRLMSGTALSFGDVPLLSQSKLESSAVVAPLLRSVSSKRPLQSPRPTITELRFRSKVGYLRMRMQ